MKLRCWLAGLGWLLASVAARADTTAPTVPTNLASPQADLTTISLTWTSSTDNVGVTAYEVFRDGVSAGIFYTNAATVTGLLQGFIYQFTVRARDAAGNWSAQSAAVPVRTWQRILQGSGEVDWEDEYDENGPTVRGQAATR